MVPMALWMTWWLWNEVQFITGCLRHGGAYGRVDIVLGSVIICLMVMLYYLQLDSVSF